MLPQWHVKDPGHFTKRAGGRLHLNTHIALTQRNRSGVTTRLSRYSVGISPKTSSHATCQGKFGHSRLTSLSHCGLILALKVELVCTSESPFQQNKTKSAYENEWSNIPPKSSQPRKKPLPPVGCDRLLRSVRSCRTVSAVCRRRVQFCRMWLAVCWRSLHCTVESRDSLLVRAPDS